MKRSFTLIFLVAMVSGIFGSPVTPGNEYDPVGKWVFSAPDAPYEYSTGTIEIKKEDETFTGTMRFEAIEYVFECEKVEFKEDVLSFILFLDGADILITMSFTEKDKMSGKALTPDAEVYLSAKRAVED